MSNPARAGSGKRRKRKARECWAWFHARTGTVCDASSNWRKPVVCRAKLSGPLIRVLMREVRR